MRTAQWWLLNSSFHCLHLRCSENLRDATLSVCRRKREVERTALTLFAFNPGFSTVGADDGIDYRQAESDSMAFAGAMPIAVEYVSEFIAGNTGPRIVDRKQNHSFSRTDRK